MRKLPEHEIQQNKTFRITKDEYQRLNALANSMGLTFADFIRNALKLYENKCIKEKRSERGLFGKYGYKENTKDIIGYDINKV